MGLFAKDRPEPLAPIAPAPAGDAKSAPSGAAPTVLGQGTRYDGRLSGEDDVVILGHFKGSIELKRDLRIGESGVVEADVQAQNVHISGRVTGKVTATHKIEIDPRGQLLGSIHAPKLVVAEGAKFKGEVDMVSEAAKPGRPERAGDGASVGAPPSANRTPQPSVGPPAQPALRAAAKA